MTRLPKDYENIDNDADYGLIFVTNFEEYVGLHNTRYEIAVAIIVFVLSSMCNVVIINDFEL